MCFNEASIVRSELSEQKSNNSRNKKPEDEKKLMIRLRIKSGKVWSASVLQSTM